MFWTEISLKDSVSSENVKLMGFQSLLILIWRTTFSLNIKIQACNSLADIHLSTSFIIIILFVPFLTLYWFFSTLSFWSIFCLQADPAFLQQRMQSGLNRRKKVNVHLTIKYFTHPFQFLSLCKLALLVGLQGGSSWKGVFRIQSVRRG